MSLSWLPNALGDRAGTGLGFHIGPMLGLRVWGQRFGWFVQGGYAWHFVSHSLALGSSDGELTFRLGEPVVDTGIALRF